MSTEKIKRAYEILADSYDALIDTKPHNAYYDRPATLQLLPEIQGKVILDAACGPGKYAEILLSQGASITGFDSSPRMVELARKRNKDAGNFFVHDLAEPLHMVENNTIDIVLCALAMHYVKDWHPTIREFFRVLKPGGHMVISIEHPFFEYTYFRSKAYFEVEAVSCTWKSFDTTMAHTTIDYQVGIIGAGFAGLVAALRLKKSGRNSFVVFEKSSEAGGTWRDNIYPGCACDIASPLYSFSGEPNPEWSRRYASQPEIFAYIRQVIQKNGLQSHIQYNTEIVEALFRKESGAWVLRDQQGRQVRVRLLVLALGPLNRPSIPDFPGMGDYKGTMFHSSQWNTGCGLTGKRVAVIGTGASAIQIIPSIVPIVSQLLVFQRTPPWVSPRMDRKITPAWQQ
jgi:ubiquinone/menaquinone biosynthesis C-methylase UbiE